GVGEDHLAAHLRDQGGVHRLLQRGYLLRHCAWGVSQLVGHRHHRAAARQLAKGSELPETQIHIATLNQIMHFLSLVLMVSCGDDGRTPVIPCAAWATACETTIPLHFRPRMPDR